MNRQSVRIPVFGLACGAGDLSTVERALSCTHGVVEAYGNPGTEAAYVTYDPTAVTVAELRRVVERAGYAAGTTSPGG